MLKSINMKRVHIRGKYLGALADPRALAFSNIVVNGPDKHSKEEAESAGLSQYDFNRAVALSRGE